MVDYSCSGHYTIVVVVEIVETEFSLEHYLVSGTQSDTLRYQNTSNTAFSSFNDLVYNLHF